MSKNAIEPALRQFANLDRASVPTAIRIAVRILIAAGLATDAWIHFDLARHYDVVAAQISEGTLFRLESLASALTALLVVAFYRRITLALAFLVAASAIAAMLLSTYTDPGQIGPFPDMYEPTWFPEKTLALAAESVAAAAALTGFVVESWHRRGR